jgi:hypothetical protein
VPGTSLNNITDLNGIACTASSGAPGTITVTTATRDAVTMTCMPAGLTASPDNVVASAEELGTVPCETSLIETGVNVAGSHGWYAVCGAPTTVACTLTITVTPGGGTAADSDV